MELMDISLNILYERVYNLHHARFEENVIGHIAVSVIDALDYLKRNLEIIHRDVKPSNILVNRCGMVKLCDFGISGQLIDSLAKTHDAGCQPYLAVSAASYQFCGSSFLYFLAFLLFLDISTCCTIIFFSQSVCRIMARSMTFAPTYGPLD
ncbi:unnamed protein product [Cylicostephanus goldi]|uniref:mitogen-activated protein kinase kinase n=1 Tax=Cylicostephanus goldi TaxID=71465 RepID=A0A3P6TL63_CYLGO|nr:unnamed protein product [Cylicostephanus goldi]